MRIEMGKQFIVRKVPKARAIIRHRVGRTGYIKSPELVSESPLVKRHQPKEVRRRAGDGHCLFCRPRKSSQVVSTSTSRSLRDIHCLGQNVIARQDTSQFKIRDGNGAIRVGPRHKRGRNVRREQGTPKEGWMGHGGVMTVPNQGSGSFTTTLISQDRLQGGIRQ